MGGEPMMRRLLLVLSFICPLAPMGWSQTRESDRDIQILIKQGRGTSAGRAAWERIVAGGPELLPTLLKAMETSDIVAANWLRTAFDQIVDKEIKGGGKGID